MRDDPKIGTVRARAYTVPTDAPEADGTLSWDKTTIVVVHVEAGGETGLGYSYTDASVARLIVGTLASRLTGLSAFDIARANAVLWGAVRNLGRSGLAATAISALDTALWDLKARLLDVSLASLFGQTREYAEIYGSGGFTSYDDRQLREQLAGWVERDGCRAVKMKVGSAPERDPARMAVAKAAIGDASLFIDANGAFTRSTPSAPRRWRRGSASRGSRSRYRATIPRGWLPSVPRHLPAWKSPRASTSIPWTTCVGCSTWGGRCGPSGRDPLRRLQRVPERSDPV